MACLDRHVVKCRSLILLLYPAKVDYRFLHWVGFISSLHETARILMQCARVGRYAPSHWTNFPRFAHLLTSGISTLPHDLRLTAYIYLNWIIGVCGVIVVFTRHSALRNLIIACIVQHHRHYWLLLSVASRKTAQSPWVQTFTKLVAYQASSCKAAASWHQICTLVGGIHWSIGVPARAESWRELLRLQMRISMSHCQRVVPLINVIHNLVGVNQFTISPTLQSTWSQTERVCQLFLIVITKIKLVFGPSDLLVDFSKVWW